MNHKLQFSFIFFIIISWLMSCQPLEDVSITKDGKQYGITNVPFKGQWWHYYERGLSFADGCLWKQAESDLREALKKRSDDKKNARTYGRHFLDLPEHDPGYFPHRELGIVLYRQGQIEEAIQELTSSLESETSARAQLYLDRARKILINKNSLDRNTPEIVFDSPSQGFITNTSDILIRGMAKDDTFVQKIIIGNKPVKIDVSAQEIRFRMSVRLKHGKNIIPVKAVDLSGREKTEYIVVNLDRIGPVISIDDTYEESVLPDSQFMFTANVFDNIGIAEIIINKKKTQYKGEKIVPVELFVSKQSFDSIPEIKVKDLAGNITSYKHDFNENIKHTSQSKLLAEYGNNSIGTQIPGKNLEDIEKKYLNKQTPDNQKKDIANILFASVKDDMTRPEIKLKHYNDENKQYTVYLDEILIQGSIRDNGQVKQLWFNKEKMGFSGKNNAFSYIHDLQEGINYIIIRGLDDAGNEARKSIRILHKRPLVLDYDSRLSMEIKEFKEKPETLDLGLDFKETLDSIMFERKRFQVITEDEIDEGFESDCFLKGKIKKHKNYVEIWANLFLSTKDKKKRSRRMTKVDVHKEHQETEKELIVDRELIEEMAREIHLKLAYEIPLLQGKVMETDGKIKITTDLGAETMVKEGMDLIVFEKNEEQPEQDFENLGKAVIDKIRGDKSYAKIKQGEEKTISQGHHVVTR